MIQVHLEHIIFILISYVIGSIPTGIIVTRFMGAADPRKIGSGNIGATNVGRSAGKTAGIVTLAGDCLKGLLPTLAALKLYPSVQVVGLAGFAAFLGHIFPVFLGFKGGKGVATALGVFVVISPLATLLSAVLFAVLVGVFRYVSVGSMVAAAAMPLFLGLFVPSASYILLGAMVAVVIILRHGENIKRLLAGKENKIGRR